ncbi:MAG: L,D-transpeptidase family protein [Anaerolineales bacterium]
MAGALNWKTLCVQAKQALAAGERSQARRLAHQAAKQAPQREEPWLLLAAMASQRASQAYVQKALEINPRSRKALAALSQAEEHPAQAPRLRQANHAAQERGTALALPRSANLALLSLLALTAAFAVFAWLRPPSVDHGLRVMGAAAANQLDAFLASETPQPSATFTATFTPFATRTSLPSSTPTSTPTLPATQVPSSTPTPLADLELVIEKFDLKLPTGLGENERWIDINLSEQTLSAYEGTRLVISFVISSGRAGAPTVLGEYKIWAKVRIQDMSGQGYYIRDVPWVMYFYKDYGIHGTWWHNNFGTPMSAGCVNMTIADAEWMYQWASLGTTVMVHY